VAVSANASPSDGLSAGPGFAARRAVMLDAAHPSILR